jgi:hypothetical protein
MTTTLDERVVLLRSRIAEANSGLAAAEQEMQQAIEQLAPVLVGDKRMTSEALDRAFLKLKGARHLITDLEKMLAAALATPRA